MSKTIKNQHFVAQSYLRYWCNEKGLLNVFDAEHNKGFTTNPKNVASGMYAHDTPKTLNQEDPGTYQIFEKFYSEIEGQLIPILDFFNRYLFQLRSLRIDVAAFQIDMHPSDIHNLSLYVTFQYIRNQEMRNLLQILYEDYARKMVKEFSPLVTGENVSSTELPAIDPDFIKSFHSETLNRKLSIYHSFIKRKTLCFGISPYRQTLLTSDNPVVLLPPQNSGGGRLLGIASDELKIALPISPHAVILLEDPRIQRKRNWKFLTSEEVTDLNKSQFQQSHRQVYSNAPIENFTNKALRERVEWKRYQLERKKVFLEADWEEDSREFRDLVRRLPKGSLSKDEWLNLMSQKGNEIYGLFERKK